MRVKVSTPADVKFLAEISTGMCLERIVEITEEFDHLNNLIMLHIEKGGGFTSTRGIFQNLYSRFLICWKSRFASGIVPA